MKFTTDVTNSTTNLWKKKCTVSKIPGSLNLKFTFQFDHSSILNHNNYLSQYFMSQTYAKFPEVGSERTTQDKPRERYGTV